MHLSNSKVSSTRRTRDDVTSVIDSIRSIVKVLRDSARDSEQKLGISSAQLYVLQELREQSGLSINQLAERTYTHQSSVSTVVGKLVDGRLATRSPGKTDARTVTISLTPAGRALIRRSAGTGQARLVKALGTLSRSDLRAFTMSLEALTKVLSESEVVAEEKSRRVMQA